MSDSTGSAGQFPITKHDAIIFVYNVGAVVSGAYLVAELEITETGALLAVSILLAAFWTLYFRLTMLRRFEDHPRFQRRDGPRR